MNEFLEWKPGVSADKLLTFNGESVLLSNAGKHRNIVCGGELILTTSASLYGQGPLANGRLSWVVVDDERVVYARGEQEVQHVAMGQVEEIAEIRLTVPNLDMPKKLQVEAVLSGGEYQVRNSWEYWAFPKVDVITDSVSVHADGIRILKALDEVSLEEIARGARHCFSGMIHSRLCLRASRS